MASADEHRRLRSGTHSRALLLALALVAISSTGARADDQELARAHFATGRSYYDQNRFDEALREFQEAYRLSKRVGFLYNIGVCHEQLGHVEDALAAYQGYILSVSDAADRAEVQGRIDRLKEAQKARAAAGDASPRAPSAAPSTVASPALSLTASPPPARRPVWKRGWFWGVVGGAAALVVAGAVVGGVVATSSNGPRTLSDVSLR